VVERQGQGRGERKEGGEGEGTRWREGWKERGKGDCLQSLEGMDAPGWFTNNVVSLQAENRELRCSTSVVSLAVHK